MNELTTKGTYKKVDLSKNGDKTSQAVQAQKKWEVRGSNPLIGTNLGVPEWFNG